MTKGTKRTYTTNGKVLNPQSAIRNPQSSIRNPQSAIAPFHLANRSRMRSPRRPLFSG